MRHFNFAVRQVEIKNMFYAGMRLLPLLMMIAFIGCNAGSDDRQFNLSGTVTHKGVPVPFGTIIFDPDRGAGNSGPQGVAEITNGKYDTSSGAGIVGGAYIVQITGFGEKPNVNDESVIIKPLFPENKRKVDLPKQTTTMDFDVK